MPSHIRRKLVSLVGERPLVKCVLEGKRCEGLWDTGAMVSMVGLDWLKENFPEVNILSVMEFVEGDNLHLCTANNGKVVVEGVAIQSFSIGVPWFRCRLWCRRTR